MQAKGDAVDSSASNLQVRKNRPLISQTKSTGVKMAKCQSLGKTSSLRWIRWMIRYGQFECHVKIGWGNGSSPTVESGDL